MSTRCVASSTCLCCWAGVSSCQSAARPVYAPVVCVCVCVCAPMGAASSLVSLHRVDERSTHTRCCVQSTMAHAMPPSVVARLRAMPGNKVRWRRRACRAGVHAGPSHPVSAMLWRVCLPWSAMRRLPGQQSAVGERFVRRVALPGVLWQAPWPGRTHQLRALGANGLVVCEADQDDGGVCVCGGAGCTTAPHARGSHGLTWAGWRQRQASPMVREARGAGLAHL